MGCNSSNSTEEAENIKPEAQKKKKENLETIEPNQRDNEKENENNNKNESEKIKNEKNKKDFLNLNSKKKILDKDFLRINTEENKDALSNVLTEGVVTSDGRLQMHKQHFNGVTLMKGIEECFSEDLNEDEIFEIVEDALGDHIVQNNDKQIPGTINTNQAKAVANILYNKINAKNEEDDKNGEVDLKNYPELKNVNIKIGVCQLTRDVIKNYMFNGQNVDDYQIDLTYNNLTKDNDNLKALSIQINP